MPFEVLLRFGRWDDVLAEPDHYPDYMPLTKTLRLAARAVAIGLQVMAGLIWLLAAGAAVAGVMTNEPYPAPRLDRNDDPSGSPMRSSWAMTPAWVWNSPPGSSVTR